MTPPYGPRGRGSVRGCCHTGRAGYSKKGKVMHLPLRIARASGAAAIAAVLGLAGCGDAGAPAPSAVAATASAPSALQDIPPLLPPVGVKAPGYLVEPLTPNSYHMSLIYRLRNAILHGLSETGSHYAISGSSVTKGSSHGLLYGVTARAKANPPPIPANVIALMGAKRSSSTTVSGHTITTFDLGTYSMAVVDDGPRRAILVIEKNPAETNGVAVAVAGALG